MPAAIKPKRRAKPKRKADESAPVPAGRDKSWRSPGWAPDLDVVSLCDYVSDVVLAFTADSIKTGRSADGRPQRPLKANAKQGYRARKGKRPGILGWTGRKKNLPDKLRRGKIKIEGTKRVAGPVQRGKAGPTTGEPTRARVTIRPNSAHRGYVAAEAKKGTSFFAENGDIEAAVDDAIKVWLKAAMAGTPPQPEPDEHDADQVTKQYGVSAGRTSARSPAK